jgi:hypothetical protein
MKCLSKNRLFKNNNIEIHQLRLLNLGHKHVTCEAVQVLAKS